MDLPRQSVPDLLTVWLVEDADDYRETIRELVEAAPGLRCPQAFKSGEQLLTHLNEEFAPEVILLDIGLPGIDGIEVVRRVRPIAPATGIVMLTVHEDTDCIFDALCAGAHGYLSKTESADGIIQAIYDVARGGSAMSPQIARRVLNIFAQIKAPHYDYGLTSREKDVLNELVRGKSKKRIAAGLSLSIHTVDTHLRSIYAKLHVHTQTGAVAKALGEKLV